MKKLLLLFILSSCASLDQRRIPVTSRQQALMVIKNQINFLNDTFIQSKEPYYGGLRWSEECLKDNIVGIVLEEKGSIRSQSQLILNIEGNAGHCKGQKNIFLMLYCDGDDYVREYRIPIDSKKNKPGIISCI